MSTLEDYGTLATIRELAVSPDGKFVAYTEARWDKADDLSKTDLWIVATDGKGELDAVDRRSRERSASSEVVATAKNLRARHNRKSVTDGETPSLVHPRR